MVSSILTELEECQISNAVIVQGFSGGHCGQQPFAYVSLVFNWNCDSSDGLFFPRAFGSTRRVCGGFCGPARACHHRSEAAAQQQVFRVTVVAADLGPVLITATALMNSTDAPRVKFAL